MTADGAAPSLKSGGKAARLCRYFRTDSSGRRGDKKTQDCAVKIMTELDFQAVVKVRDVSPAVTVHFIMQ